MKSHFSILAVLSLMIFSSCMNNHSSEKLISPSGKYYFTTTVNRTDKSKEDYSYVVLSLFNTDDQLITKLNTKAGDANKWAIAWDTKMDTIIMNSSDIGVYAWGIDNGEIRELIKEEITEEINHYGLKIHSFKNHW